MKIYEHTWRQAQVQAMISVLCEQVLELMDQFEDYLDS